MQNLNKPTGVKRIFAAFGYSMAGLITAFKEETSFRQEVILTCIMLPALFFLPVAPVIKWATVAAHLSVMVVELINSAIEAVVDLASPDHHELAKKAKDFGSGAVLLCLVSTTLLWGYIILETYLHFKG